MDTSVVLTRPAPDDQGNLTVTWRLIKVIGSIIGWAVPDLDPNSNCAFMGHCSYIFGEAYLGGLGTQVIQRLPSGRIFDGDTVSLRYHPARGTMHARVNGGAEVLCFTDLRNDLVPAICLFGKGESCAIVVRFTQNNMCQ